MCQGGCKIYLISIFLFYMLIVQLSCMCFIILIQDLLIGGLLIATILRSSKRFAVANRLRYPANQAIFEEKNNVELLFMYIVNDALAVE